MTWLRQAYLSPSLISLETVNTDSDILDLSQSDLGDDV